MFWTGARHTDGHGQVMIHGKQYRAHRVAWFIRYGKWPENQLNHIRECNIPWCINPKHSYDGTQTQNNIDTGFMRRTPEQWAAIKADMEAGMNQKRLKAKYHISGDTLVKVRRGDYG